MLKRVLQCSLVIIPILSFVGCTVNAYSMPPNAPIANEFQSGVTQVPPPTPTNFQGGVTSQTVTPIPPTPTPTPQPSFHGGTIQPQQPSNFHGGTIQPQPSNFHGGTIQPQPNNFNGGTVQPQSNNFHGGTSTPAINQTQPQKRTGFN